MLKLLSCVGLFSPLTGFCILLLASFKMTRKLTGIIACSSVLLSFLCFSTLLYFYDQEDLSPQLFTLYRWLNFDTISIDFTLMIDPLSLLMCLIISGVGFLIHLYSNGYMEYEESFVRYFAFMNFFVFAMLLLVLAENLLLLFVGWEGVGLASYLLIGFWYQRPAAARAATKAFIINRIGDLGLLLGLLLTLHQFGSLDITKISEASGSISSGSMVTAIALLYFIGAIGKSAQLPLHTWLPDAMEGPTPVSALIHAATMVTAGVYLVVRMHFLFVQAPVALQLIGVIGGCTALFAALSAFGQTDLKRVLAYSTISQLGFMFVACGIGAFYAAMFHLTTHAFIKGLLFLSAGNVVHMLHGETEMKKMGGLWHRMPKTALCFLIGALALSGLPPLAAFFSKDLILEQEFLAHETLLFTIAFIASLLTAAYLTRAFFLTFAGRQRVENENSLHEAPAIMLIPVVCLAFLSFFGGFLGLAFGNVSYLESFLDEIDITLAIKEAANSFLYSSETWISVLCIVLVIAATASYYFFFSEGMKKPFEVLRKAFYLDEIYNAILVRPLRVCAAWLNDKIEPMVFDGTVTGCVLIVQKAAVGLQKLQNGQLRFYVSWIVWGAVLLMILFLI